MENFCSTGQLVALGLVDSSVRATAKGLVPVDFEFTIAKDMLLRVTHFLGIYISGVASYFNFFFPSCGLSSEVKMQLQCILLTHPHKKVCTQLFIGTMIIVHDITSLEEVYLFCISYVYKCLSFVIQTHAYILSLSLSLSHPTPQPEEFKESPDVYAVGFEELVGLTASNIVSVSSSNRKEWGVELQKVLSRDTPYELLTAEQLVGVCLYIFIKPKLIPYVK